MQLEYAADALDFAEWLRLQPNAIYPMPAGDNYWKDRA
jgi:hypothetical protein